MQLPSYHEWQVGVPYTVSDIEEATDISVASMVGNEAWPQSWFEGCYCACYILVYVPSVFGEIFCYWVKAVFIESCFISSYQTQNFWISWVPSKLPVLQFEHSILWKALESFIINGLALGNAFHATLWYGEVSPELTYNVCKSIKLRHWFWLHNYTKIFINYLWVSGALEKYWIEFTSKQVVHVL